MRCLTAAMTLLAFVSSGAANASDDLTAFPPPAPGMVRYVLRLPPLADETTAKLELVAGRTVKVDTRNRYFFVGSPIKAETIEGWGFTRYVAGPLGPMGGTLMAVEPNAPKVDRFVPMGGEPYLIRYNSRLPVVVYASADVEIRYRVWTAGTEPRAMDRG